MLDCPNGEMRDLLPELLHDRLDADARLAVQRHVERCADCTAELALLRDLRAVLSAAPALDISAIVAAATRQDAVPAARGVHAGSTGHGGARRWVGWRAAAAITMIAAGGTSLVVVQRGGVSALAVDSIATVAMVAPAPAPSPALGRGLTVAEPAETSAAGSGERAGAVPGSRELDMSGTVGDLSDGELALLLDELDALDAVTPADAETPVVAPLAPAQDTP